MSDTLYSCALCGRKNFTAVGYASHRCEKLAKGAKRLIENRIPCPWPEVSVEAQPEVDTESNRLESASSFLGNLAGHDSEAEDAWESVELHSPELSPEPEEAGESEADFEHLATVEIPGFYPHKLTVWRDAEGLYRMGWGKTGAWVTPRESKVAVNMLEIAVTHAVLSMCESWPKDRADEIKSQVSVLMDLVKEEIRLTEAKNWLDKNAAEPAATADGEKWQWWPKGFLEPEEAPIQLGTQTMVLMAMKSETDERWVPGSKWRWKDDYDVDGKPRWTWNAPHAGDEAYPTRRSAFFAAAEWHCREWSKKEQKAYLTKIGIELDTRGETKPEELAVAKVAPAQLVKVPKLPVGLVVAGSWDGARKWRDAAKQLEQGKLFAQVMLGFELLTLKAVHSQQGKRTDVTGAGGVKLWRKLVDEELGFSEDTARRLTLMAEAATPRLKKVPELATFDPSTQSVSALAPEVQEALAGVVRKLTDGATQADFMLEMGLVKGPSNKGGRGKGGDGRKALSISEQADALLESARKDWAEIEELLLAGYIDKFLMLPDPEIEAQVGALEKALKARRAYLAKRPEHRDQEFTREISALLQ
jgi:hypothetical protein